MDELTRRKIQLGADTISLTTAIIVGRPRAPTPETIAAPSHESTPPTAAATPRTLSDRLTALLSATGAVFHSPGQQKQRRTISGTSGVSIPHSTFIRNNNSKENTYD